MCRSSAFQGIFFKLTSFIPGPSAGILSIFSLQHVIMPTAGGGPLLIGCEILPHLLGNALTITKTNFPPNVNNQALDQITIFPHRLV